MDIEGNVGHLSEAEQRATGYPAEMLVAQLRPDDLLRDVEMRITVLESMQAADDDALTHKERAGVTGDLVWQYERKQLISVLAGQVLAYECEAYTQGHQG